MTDKENHTIRLLQEMRSDNAAFRAEILGRIDHFQGALDSINKQLASLNVKILSVRGRVRNLETDVESLAAVVRNGD